MKVLLFLSVLFVMPPVEKKHIPSRDLFEMINRYRESNNLNALQDDPERQSSTDKWSEHIFKQLEHDKIVNGCENLATNDCNTYQLFQSWVNSKPHRANMLNPRLKYMSVSVYYVDYRYMQEYYGVFRGFYGKK